MQERLKKLMKDEGLNSTRLADLLGIQASGISHIMSGRNKPSYDFLIKLLRRFPQINPDWLLLNKGPMYRDEIKKSSSIEDNNISVHSSGMLFPDSAATITESYEPDNRDIIPVESSRNVSELPDLSELRDSADVDSVIICYDDKSCRVFKVRK